MNYSTFQSLADAVAAARTNDQITTVATNIQADMTERSFSAALIALVNQSLDQISNANTTTVNGYHLYTGAGQYQELAGLLPLTPTGYKEYVALLTQAGTAAPVATVLSNTLGTITLARTNTGRYTLTTSGLFTDDKTWFSLTPFYGGAATDFALEWDSANVYLLNTYNGGAFSDDMLLDAAVMIRVYN